MLIILMIIIYFNTHLMVHTLLLAIVSHPMYLRVNARLLACAHQTFNYTSIIYHWVLTIVHFQLLIFIDGYIVTSIIIVHTSEARFKSAWHIILGLYSGSRSCNQLVVLRKGDSKVLNQLRQHHFSLHLYRATYADNRFQVLNVY